MWRFPSVCEEVHNTSDITDWNRVLKQKKVHFRLCYTEVFLKTDWINYIDVSEQQQI